MVSRDLSPFSESIKDLLDAEHPVLSMAAKHFFEKRHGKRFRPTIVALMGELRERRVPAVIPQCCRRGLVMAHRDTRVNFVNRLRVLRASCPPPWKT